MTKNTEMTVEEQMRSIVASTHRLCVDEDFETCVFTEKLRELVKSAEKRGYRRGQEFIKGNLAITIKARADNAYCRSLERARRAQGCPVIS